VAAAVDILRELLDDHVRLLGPHHPNTLTIRHNLASALSEWGELAAAVDLYRELLDDRTRVLGADHPHTLGTKATFESLLSESEE
jgi:hypothetical protein